MGKKKNEGHHGGAWKVAYADFVTAMMALFLVLWISAQDQEILIATSRYFQNPFNSPMDRTNGVMSGDSSGGGGMNSMDDTPPSTLIDMALLHQLANDLYKMLDVQEIDEEERPIDISVTSDGMRIVLFNRKNRPFFKPYTANLSTWGEMVVQNLAWLMDRYNMSVCIDSYTGDEYRSGKPDYGPWELSSDRANTIRRGLVHYALDPEKVSKVTAHVTESPPGKNMTVNDDTTQRIEVSMSASNLKK